MTSDLSPFSSLPGWLWADQTAELSFNGGDSCPHTHMLTHMPPPRPPGGSPGNILSDRLPRGSASDRSLLMQLSATGCSCSSAPLKVSWHHSVFHGAAFNERWTWRLCCCCCRRLLVMGRPQGQKLQLQPSISSSISELVEFRPGGYIREARRSSEIQLQLRKMTFLELFYLFIPSLGGFSAL